MTFTGLSNSDFTESGLGVEVKRGSHKPGHDRNAAFMRQKRGVVYCLRVGSGGARCSRSCRLKAAFPSGFMGSLGEGPGRSIRNQ